MKHTTLFLLIIFLVACKEQPKDSPEAALVTSPPEFHLQDSLYAILSYKADWHWIFEDVKPSNLTRTELAEIETIIELAVNENNEQQQKNLEEHNRTYHKNQRSETGYELQLNRFTRQYVPVINADGQKEVWINFFCGSSNFSAWKSDILMVHDGGNCFFNMKVNLDTKTYSELSINGYA